MTDRFSVADGTSVETDPRLVASLEAENALRQFDAAMLELDKWLAGERKSLKPSMISALQRYAVEGLDEAPGTYRAAGVEIRGSKHQTPDASEVSELVENLCDYINSGWDRETAVHLAAYILWRVNWIHPFRDGNGRTARIVSYIILNAHAGFRLPGTRTIPDQISDNKKPYYDALEAADESVDQGSLDLSKMEEMLENCLATQLLSAYESATGKDMDHDDLKSELSGQISVEKDQKRTGIVGWVENHPATSALIGVVFAIIVSVLIAIFGAK